MRRTVNEIRESEVEDALIANLDIFKEIFATTNDVRLITRQLRLVDGKKRLDILLAIGNEIILVELKTTEFDSEHVTQILSYREELKKLQQDKKLVAGEIVPALLVTACSEEDKDICSQNNVNLYKYSPVDILTKYYEKVASIAPFMKIRPVDLGVFNLGLRVLRALEDGLLTAKEIANSSKLSVMSVSHHLKFAIELALVTRRKNRYYLTDMGLKYLSLEDESLTGDELSEEQATLLRDYVAKDPFSSPVVFGIFSLVESTFMLARNSYPVDLKELSDFFLKSSGKQYEWHAKRSLSTATYTFLNYAIRLGLLGKIGKNIIITPSGFRFILMLQLYKSIQMVESLSPESHDNSAFSRKTTITSG